MSKKETKTEIVTNDNTTSTVSAATDVSPEAFMELQSGVQTIMNLGLAEKLYLEDLSDRLFYIDDVITPDILHTITMQIYKYNGCDCYIEPEHRKPIILVFNSCGGSVFDGIGLMDAIRNSNTPVIGICVGYAESMAFNIFAVCHHRFAVPNAIFMYHDGYEDTGMTTSTKAKDWAKFSPRVDERINKMIAEKTKFTPEYLQTINPHDTFWFADELKEWNMVDGIIGRDVDMGDLFSFMSDLVECNCEECTCHE